jgi:hypothetical protein
VLRHARELRNQLSEDDHEANAALVLASIVSEDQRLFARPGIDWDGLLEFLERLMPLILLLIQMFGAV